MNALPLEVVVEYAVLKAIVDKEGIRMNPGKFRLYWYLEDDSVAKLATLNDGTWIC